MKGCQGFSALLVPHQATRYHGPISVEEELPFSIFDTGSQDYIAGYEGKADPLNEAVKLATAVTSSFSICAPEFEPPLIEVDIFPQMWALLR